MIYLICQISIDIANFHVLKKCKVKIMQLNNIQENGVKLIIKSTNRVCALVHIYAAYNSVNSKHACPSRLFQLSTVVGYSSGRVERNSISKFTQGWAICKFF